ncbi:hypothetical protein CJO79_18620 (plasmid) [Ralstonia solanacearum]|nr:hypothetical protein CJO76_18635 [Ralstonia solanacearum]AXV93022.1 hypothetical protein CJO79_18620 [Ralstonia solanacearum]AXW21082.1 hypothetical protein CJO85_18685 [Ralstonia solanacearum]AXW77920.1 hypothetical protein CJO97_18615 [Ralstonia solanacearum]
MNARGEAGSRSVYLVWPRKPLNKASAEDGIGEIEQGHVEVEPMLEADARLAKAAGGSCPCRCWIEQVSCACPAGFLH